MANSETAYKLFFKVFYRQTNKKEYKSQILEHNLCYTNIITMHNIIVIANMLAGNNKNRACY